MVNYNMGRYYAWTNLANLVRSTLRKYSSAPTYKFSYIPPKQTPLPKIVAFQDWKSNKEREKSTFSITLLGIAFICFAAARWIYVSLNDNYYGYYYQIKSPVLCRAIELISMDLAELTDPFFDIYPKNRYEINQIYPRLFELLFQSQKRIAENDRKVIQLRKQIQEYDRKNK